MKPYNAFGRVPPSVSPSQPVRHWDTALLGAAITFWLLYGVLLTLIHPLAGEGSLRLTMAAGSNVPLAVLTFGQSEWASTLRDYVATLDSPLFFGTLLIAAFMASAVASMWVLLRLSRPKINQYHIRGAELLRGEAAKIQARHITDREKARDSPYQVRLGEELVLGKKTLSRHVSIAGGVGAGKTQLFLEFIDALVFHPTAKALIYDVKGDFSSLYPSCPIVGVEDERSRSVPLGKMIRTKKHAAIFMQSVIPDSEGSSGNKFFDNTARLVGVGVLMTLIHTRGQEWGASDLATMMNKQAPELAALFTEHYEKAAQALGDPNAKTATDIMATVASYTRIFDELDLAWGPYRYDKDLQIRRDEDGEPLRRKEWNPMEWIRDDYKGKRCIILQGGGDKQITRGFISAIINLITPEIVSPALPDSEEGRCLAFVLDEMPTVGRIQDFELLAVAGRSKGVVMIMGWQDIAQIKSLYGPEMTATIESTVYTKLVCELQMGETRDHIAKSFSTKIIGSISHVDGRVHEEGKAVVYPDELTTGLGFRRGPQYGPEGWGIQFLAAVGGSNPMILTLPGYDRKKVRKTRPGRIAGAWTHADFERVAVERVESVMEQHDREEQNRKDRKVWRQDRPLYQHTSRKMLGLDEDEAEELIERIRPDSWKPIVVPPYSGLIRD